MKSLVAIARFVVSKDGPRIQGRVPTANIPQPQPEPTFLRRGTSTPSLLSRYGESASPNEFSTQFHHGDDTWSFSSTEKAKDVLTSTSVIAFYRSNSPLLLRADASSLNGLGFILKQYDQTEIGSSRRFSLCTNRT